MKIKKKDIAIVLILIVALLILKGNIPFLSLVCGEGPAVPYNQMHIAGGLSSYSSDWCSGVMNPYPCCLDSSYTLVENWCVKTVTASVTDSKTLAVPNFTTATMKYGAFYTWDQLYSQPQSVNLKVMIGGDTYSLTAPYHYVDLGGIGTIAYNDCEAVNLVVASNSIDVTSVLSPYKGQTISYSVIGDMTPCCLKPNIVDILYNIEFNYTTPQPAPQTPTPPSGFSNILSQLTTVINNILSWFKTLFGL